MYKSEVDQSPPPAYVKPEDVEPPPSYESLFGKIKKAKTNSNDNVSFVKSTCGLIMGSMACTICLGVFLAIPITMIVIGAKYLDDCPAERMIPIYLIVAGSFGIVSNIISMVRSCLAKKDEDGGEEGKDKKASTGPEQIINVFLTAWFIAGNVWVYRTYDDWQSSNSALDSYCHPTLYYFAFWIITSTYILIGVLILVCIACCLFLCCCGKCDDD